jgi:hypothetical protein
MVLATNFQKQNSWKVKNCLLFISPNCRQWRKLFPSLSILLEDHDQNRHSKFMLYLRARSFSHQLHLLLEFRVKDVYVFHVFLTAHFTRWNFNGVCASN